MQRSYKYDHFLCCFVYEIGLEHGLMLVKLDPVFPYLLMDTISVVLMLLIDQIFTKLA